jgi:P2-related tail formation protein
MRHLSCRNWFEGLKVDEQIKERVIATRWESASALLRLKSSLAARRNAFRPVSRLEAILAWQENEALWEPPKLHALLSALLTSAASLSAL